MKEKGENESGGNVKESVGKEFELVWACGAKRGALRMTDGDGSTSIRKEEEKMVGQSEE